LRASGVGVDSCFQLSIELRVVLRGGGDVREERAVLEVAIAETIEAIPPGVLDVWRS